MKKLNRWVMVGVVLVVLSAITTPLLGQYMNQFIDWAFTEVYRVGAFIALVTCVYVVAGAAYYLGSQNAVRVPKKAQKRGKRDGMKFELTN